MSRPVFDMNVFVEYKNLITDYHFSKMALSSVVLYELTATTIDKSIWQNIRLGEDSLTKIIYFSCQLLKIGGNPVELLRVSDTVKNRRRKAKLRKIRTRKNFKTIF